MGNAPSLVTALQTALKERELKVSTKVLGSFVKEVDRVAPWFICSGSLSIPSWDKLGKDLDREEEEGRLKGGTRPLWKLIRACLQDEKCEKVIKAGQRALTEIQESMSETERETELARGRKRTAKMKVKKPQSEGESPPRARVKEPRGAGDDRLGESSKYPWEELRELQLSNREQEEELLSSEEEEETMAVKRGSKGTSKAERQTKEKMTAGRSPSPTAPPPYVSGTHTFCHPDTIQAIRQMFPVFEDNGVRSHQPLSHKQVKDLAESVWTYGVSANYTIAQIERITETAMTPTDWQYLAKACLSSMGQYIEWKALWHDISMTQARANAAEGQPAWSYDMLTGQGQWVVNQTAFPIQPGSLQPKIQSYMETVLAIHIHWYQYRANSKKETTKTKKSTKSSEQVDSFQKSLHERIHFPQYRKNQVFGIKGQNQLKNHSFQESSLDIHASVKLVPTTTRVSGLLFYYNKQIKIFSIGLDHTEFHSLEWLDHDHKRYYQFFSLVLYKHRGIAFKIPTEIVAGSLLFLTTASAQNFGTSSKRNKHRLSG
ncbi:Endogenous Retrovirus Group K Member 6 Gag Polyprotein [Manis pentadactyla]|nr:Endogenous Retrovirus Group K Member 6 Gag Polyprotein [Manis pentadactyla]